MNEYKIILLYFEETDCVMLMISPESVMILIFGPGNFLSYELNSGDFKWTLYCTGFGSLSYNISPCGEFTRLLKK